MFVGSSVEQLSIAYAVQENLDYDAEVTVWSQGVFKPTKTALLSLADALAKFDLSVFVFATDDILVMRQEESRAVRDNVIFEFGLFVGALGIGKCFLIVPRATDGLHMPSDLLGITPLTYNASRTDGNIVAALGAACNQLRRVIFARHAQAEQSETSPHAKHDLAARFLADWNGKEILSARQTVRKGLPLPLYGHDDDPESRDAYYALQRLFAFLESMADAITSGRVEEGALRPTFADPVRQLWPHIYVLLAPPNHAQDWWDPLPKLAELAALWSGEASNDG